MCNQIGHQMDGRMFRRDAIKSDLRQSDEKEYQKMSTIRTHEHTMYCTVATGLLYFVMHLMFASFPTVGVYCTTEQTR